MRSVVQARARAVLESEVVRALVHSVTANNHLLVCICVYDIVLMLLSQARLQTALAKSENDTVRAWECCRACWDATNPIARFCCFLSRPGSFGSELRRIAGNVHFEALCTVYRMS